MENLNGCLKETEVIDGAFLNIGGLILKKNQAVVIHEDFGENIAIQLEVDVESTDEFIESVKELSSGSAQIIIED